MLGYLGSDFDPFGPGSDNPSGPSSGGDVIPATWSDRIGTATAAFGGIERVAYLAMAGFGLYLLFGMSQGKGRRRR